MQPNNSFVNQLKTKKMFKKTNKIINCFFMVYIFFICHSNVFSQGISGPDNIDWDTYVVYTRPTPNLAYQYFYDWTVSDPVNVTLIGVASNIIQVKVKKNTSICSFEISYVEVTDAGSFHESSTVTKTIYILPEIVLPTIYPGTNLISMENNCNRTGCNYIWSVVPSNVCPTCGASGLNTQYIYIDPDNIPISITASCIMSNCSPLLISPAIPQQTTFVVIKDPVVTGPSSLGCGGTAPSGNFSYVASQELGATTYVWSVPSFLSIVSGQNTPILTVIENALGDGYIYLQTFNGSGSPIHSSLINQHVKVCCRSNINITNDVVSSSIDQQQATLSITANNKINNGASAMYHAGDVKLEDGFSALLGCYFHGYTDGCTGVYNRIANLIDSTNNGNITHEINPKQISESNSINLKNQTNINDIKIYPNPNSGEFNLILSNKIELPNSIIISDILGNDIKTIFKPTDYKYNFNIKELNNGLYIINVYYNDKIMSKRIVKE